VSQAEPFLEPAPHDPAPHDPAGVTTVSALVARSRRYYEVEADLAERRLAGAFDAWSR